MSVKFKVRLRNGRVVVTGGGRKAPDGNAKAKPGARIEWLIDDESLRFGLKFEHMVDADSVEEPSGAWPFRAYQHDEGRVDPNGGVVSDVRTFVGELKDEDFAAYLYTASIANASSSDEFEQPAVSSDPVIIIERRR